MPFPQARPATISPALPRWPAGLSTVLEILPYWTTARRRPYGGLLAGATIRGQCRTRSQEGGS
jgi:hypothetical protein